MPDTRQRYERVALVNPPLDSGRLRCVDAGYWQPLNLLALGSYLNARHFNGEILILDQEILSRHQILDRLKCFSPDLVGLSPNLDSYQSSLGLAQLSRELGSDIVFGGNYSTVLARNILNRQPNVDYVVLSDGEIAFSDLVLGRKIDQIPNLMFREKGVIKSTPVKRGSNAIYSDIDYSLVDLEPYFKNYAMTPNRGPFSRPVSFVSQRGCTWKDKTGGCVFCSREFGSTFDDPQNVWRRLIALKDRFGIDAFMDTGDDFLGNQTWFSDLVKTRPFEANGIGLRFAYSRVNHINEENARKLRELNTFELFLGIESGNQRILKNSVKGNSLSRQIDAVSILEKYGINVAIGFVLGLPGENTASLSDSVQHIERFFEFSNINEIVVSVMTPLQGSPSFARMMQDETLRSKYGNQDSFDLEELQDDWIKNYCDVDRNAIDAAAEQLRLSSSKVVNEFVSKAA